MAKCKLKPDPYWLVFKEGVPKSFASIITDYSFLLSQPSVGMFELRSDVCLITVFLDRQSVLVNIKPTRVDQVPKAQYYSSIDLGMIIDFLAPQANFEYKFCRQPDEIGEEVERLAGSLQQYCTPIMKGDFSDWIRLKESILEKLNIPL